MAEMATTYDPGSVTTRTSGSPSFLDPDLLKMVIANRMAAAAPSYAAPARRGPAFVTHAPTATEEDDGRGNARDFELENRAMSRANAPRARFVSQVFGANIVPGQVQASAGDSGATFGGWYAPQDLERGAVTHANTGRIGSVAPDMGDTTVDAAHTAKAQAAQAQDPWSAAAKTDFYRRQAGWYGKPQEQ